RTNHPMIRNSKKRILMLPGVCLILWSRSLWAVDGLETWTLRTNPLPSTNSLFSIAAANNRFVAVGGADSNPFSPGGGVIITSSDGMNWTQTRSSGKLFHVAYGGGLFLAGGEGVLYSEERDSRAAPLS